MVEATRHDCPQCGADDADAVREPFDVGGLHEPPVMFAVAVICRKCGRFDRCMVCGEFLTCRVVHHDWCQRRGDG